MSLDIEPNVGIEFEFDFGVNPCMKSIIQKINFLKNNLFFFFAFFKNLKNEFFFKFIFQKLNFGRLVKIDFIFHLYLPIFSSH